MAKRGPDDEEEQVGALKKGERPVKNSNDEIGEYEDEFEDEFESENEVLEAGVDGRPDAEREADEQKGTSYSAYAKGYHFYQLFTDLFWSEHHHGAAI